MGGDNLKIVVISGRAGSGKDTFAGMLRDHMEENGYCVLIIHYADLLKFICTNYFDWNGQKDIAGRNLLQYIGTDIVRKADPDFWVRFVADFLSFFQDRWDYVLIPDARFPNEINYLKQRGFAVTHMRINRKAAESNLTERQRTHESETALDNVSPDYYIENNGSLSSLNCFIISWLRGHNDGE